MNFAAGDLETQRNRDNEIDALEQKLARSDARIAELESRITRMKTLLGECREVIAWECNELSNDPRGREDEHRRLGRLVDAIDAARAGNGGEG